MKIGVSSYSFQTLLKRGMTYFEACQHARDMGYDGIEFIDLDLAFAPGEDNVESLAKHLRAHCEALDLDIPAYTVAADFLNGRGGAPEDEPARVCRCADIAAMLGAKVLRHDAFWRLGELRDWREGVARVVPGIRQVADYAQSLGIRTCTENHGRIMQDSDRVEYLMRVVDHPNYGWLVDMGNFLCADEEPRHAVGRRRALCRARACKGFSVQIWPGGYARWRLVWHARRQLSARHGDRPRRGTRARLRAHPAQMRAMTATCR